MKTHLLIPLLALALASSAVAQPRIVTVMITASNQTETVSIESFESVKVLTARDFGDPSRSAGVVDVTKGTSWTRNRIGYAQEPGAPIFPETLVLSGPAAITIRDTSSFPGYTRNPSNPLMVTLEIGPIAYPVTNTVSIGPAVGAQVTLQNSTNLVSWTPATNGYYTNVSENVMFFRIKLDRVK